MSSTGVRSGHTTAADAGHDTRDDSGPMHRGVGGMSIQGPDDGATRRRTAMTTVPAAGSGRSALAGDLARGARGKPLSSWLASLTLWLVSVVVVWRGVLVSARAGGGRFLLGGGGVGVGGRPCGSVGSASCSWPFVGQAVVVLLTALSAPRSPWTTSGPRSWWPSWSRPGRDHAGLVQHRRHGRGAGGTLVTSAQRRPTRLADPEVEGRGLRPDGRGALPGAADGRHGRHRAHADPLGEVRHAPAARVDAQAAGHDTGQPDGHPARGHRRDPGVPVVRPGQRPGPGGQQARRRRGHRGGPDDRPGAARRRRGEHQQPVHR